MGTTGPPVGDRENLAEEFFPWLSQLAGAVSACPEAGDSREDTALPGCATPQQWPCGVGSDYVLFTRESVLRGQVTAQAVPRVQTQISRLWSPHALGLHFLSHPIPRVTSAHQKLWTQTQRVGPGTRQGVDLEDGRRPSPVLAPRWLVP